MPPAGRYVFGAQLCARPPSRWLYRYCYRSVAGPSVAWQFGSLFTPHF